MSLLIHMNIMFSLDFTVFLGRIKLLPFSLLVSYSHMFTEPSDSIPLLDEGMDILG